MDLREAVAPTYPGAAPSTGICRKSPGGLESGCGPFVQGLHLSAFFTRCREGLSSSCSSQHQYSSTPLGRLLRWLERPRNRWVIRMWFQACSRNPMDIDRDHQPWVSPSELMKLKEQQEGVSVLGVTIHRYTPVEPLQ